MWGMPPRVPNAGQAVRLTTADCSRSGLRAGGRHGRGLSPAQVPECDRGGHELARRCVWGAERRLATGPFDSDSPVFVRDRPFLTRGVALVVCVRTKTMPIHEPERNLR